MCAGSANICLSFEEYTSNGASSRCSGGSISNQVNEKREWDIGREVSGTHTPDEFKVLLYPMI